MKNLNLNIPIVIFSLGAVIFLLAPLKLFNPNIMHEIFMMGLLMELIGIATGLFMLFRYKTTKKIMKKI